MISTHTSGSKIPHCKDLMLFYATLLFLLCFLLLGGAWGSDAPPKLRGVKERQLI